MKILNTLRNEYSEHVCGCYGQRYMRCSLQISLHLVQFVILYGLDDQIQVGIILWEGRHDKDLMEATLTAIDFFF